jgi:hypothetical protein
VRHVPHQDPHTSGVYRGWMLKATAYDRLFAALTQRGIELVNTPAAYRVCHHFPESYPFIQEWTPRSVWLETGSDPPRERIAELLRPLGDVPLIVKDYVKSRKHEWHEACFIPSARDLDRVESVTRRFLELQGDDLNQGLVYREFVDFEPVGTHPQSGMPLTREYRLFFLDGHLIQSGEYWSDVSYGEEKIPRELLTDIAGQVPSRFFSMDVAKHRNGNWMIVELGDGQVAGLPEGIDPRDFYSSIRRRLAET